MLINIRNETIGTEHYLTYGDIYKIFTTLDAQGRPAIIETDDDYANPCQYRTTDAEGNTCVCAVGALLDERLYKPEFENTLFEYFQVELERSLGHELTEKDRELLRYLQHLHDDVWERQQAHYGEGINFTAACVNYRRHTLDSPHRGLSERAFTIFSHVLKSWLNYNKALPRG